MSVAHHVAVHRPRGSAARGAGRLAAVGALLLFAVATGVLLSRHPLPLTLILAFGIGLLGTLALALSRYDAAVGLGIFLLAAVRIEPAPTDLIMFVVIAVAFVTGRFYIRRAPLIVTVLLSVFLALNMLASVEVMSSDDFDAWLEQRRAEQDAGSGELGKEEWEGVCAKCHGMNGEGGIGPRIGGSPTLTDPEALAELVRNGRRTMPAVGSGWTDEQIAELADYLTENPPSGS